MITFNSNNVRFNLSVDGVTKSRIPEFGLDSCGSIQGPISDCSNLYFRWNGEEHFGNILGIFWEYFGNILGIFWEHFGNILETFWTYFGNILGIFREHFGNILGIFWEHFGNILGTFWEHFGNILGMFWMTHQAAVYH